MKASRISDRRSARWIGVAVFAVAAALVSPARSAPVDDATRAAARTAAEEALARFDKGDFAGALDLFDRADALVHAPTLGLMAARCLEKLGRLVEASERYLAVSRLRLDPGAPDAQVKAQATAGQERAALLPRVPSVVITLPGAPSAELRVLLDGKPVPVELLGLKRPTDPGSHRLVATRGAQITTRDFVLRPGEALTVALELPAASAASLPEPLGPKAPAAPPAPAPDGSARGLGGAGWAGVGIAALGGAGLVVGAVTGGLAVSKKSTLDAAGCAGGFCPPAQQDAVSAYNTLRMVSGAGFIAGGVLAAGGVTLAILASRGRAKPTQARWSPWVSVVPGAAGGAAIGAQGAF